jgi:hypothetical protein
MEDKKQELIKLIDNLDWDRFTKTRDSPVGLPQYTMFNLVKTHLEYVQKEKTIEQKLEELGFSKNIANGLCYFYPSLEGYIKLYSGKNSNEYIDAKFNILDTDKILGFANYLVNLKNGASE